MDITGGGDGNNKFVMQMVIMAIAIIFLMPTMISIFADHSEENVAPENLDEVLDGYVSFTGSQVTNESVWALTGIYTPYGIDQNGNVSSSYSYTPDHWLYGSRVTAYSPGQFTGSSIYTVNYNDGFYYYAGNTLDGHKTGDLYTSVAMDVNEKSDIFFTPSGKHQSGEQWYYDYTGYRYAFQSLQDGYYKDENGDIKKATASNSSLSMIWYDFYGSEGLSGQLTLAGSDQGLAYLTSSDIVSAFDSTNNIAKFKMKFNGVDMNIYIKIKPEYTSAGYSVAQCFDMGYWEIMITSISTNVNTYMSTDYSLNIENIWDTLIDLFSFNMGDYGLSAEMQLIASLTISVCLYGALIGIISDKVWLIIFAGLVAIIQTIASMQFEIPDIWPFW